MGQAKAATSHLATSGSARVNKGDGLAVLTPAEDPSPPKPKPAAKGGLSHKSGKDGKGATAGPAAPAPALSKTKSSRFAIALQASAKGDSSVKDGGATDAQSGGTGVKDGASGEVDVDGGTPFDSGSGKGANAVATAVSLRAMLMSAKGVKGDVGGVDGSGRGEGVGQDMLLEGSGTRKGKGVTIAVDTEDPVTQDTAATADSVLSTSTTLAAAAADAAAATTATATATAAAVAGPGGLIGLVASGLQVRPRPAWKRFRRRPWLTSAHPPLPSRRPVPAGAVDRPLGRPVAVRERHQLPAVQPRRRFQGPGRARFSRRRGRRVVCRYVRGGGGGREGEAGGRGGGAAVPRRR